MAPRIVEGIYRGGRVELVETPQGVSEGARVKVILPDAEPVDAEARKRLREEMLEQMRRGFDFGDSPHETRDELYEERLSRYD